MSWIKRKIASLLVITLSCVLGLILFESGLRLVNSGDIWFKTKEANILRDFQFTYDISKLYQYDLLSVNYVRNEYGLRDACDSTDEIDILTIGGSTTDQRYVPFDSTYQSILEERLIAQIDDFGCVSNAGVDGHSTWGHIFSFEHWFPLIPELKPKFIVLYVGINDANFLRLGAPKPRVDINNRQRLQGFLENFEVFQALLPIYRLLQQSIVHGSAVYETHEPHPYDEDDYEVNVMSERTVALSEQNTNVFQSRMRILLEKISALGAIPICVTQPHRYVMEKSGEIYGVPNVLGQGFTNVLGEGLNGIDYDYSIRQLNNVMFELCGENTLDLYSHTFLSSHFYDGAHTTAMGSKEIGERLADFILARFF